MTPRWCQYEMKRARQLRDYPELTAAWERGEIPKSRLRVILKVVAAGTEKLWCERGRTLSVRELERLAGEEHKRAAARDESPPAPAAQAEPAESAEPDEYPRRHRRCVKAPPGVTLLFASAVETARKLEGYQVGAGQALSMMAIELMAGLSEWPDPPAREDGDPPADRAARTSESFLGDHDALNRLEGPGWEEFHRHMEEITRGWADLSWDPAPVLLEEAPPDTAGPHERVVFWSSAQCRLDAVRGRLLRIVDDRMHAQRLGFAGLGQYVRERMGLSVREARELVHLDRALSKLPVAFRMYGAGRLGKRAAWLVADIATRETDRAWTRFAMNHTLRLLEAAVEAAHLKREADPAGWRECGGYPPREISFADLTRACSLLRQPEGSAEPTASITFLVDGEQESIYEQAVGMLRALYGDERPEWWCLALMARHFLDLYGKLDEESLPARLRRTLSRRVIERDNYTCTAPECLQRGGLEADHTLMRSRGGADAMWNLSSLCGMEHRFTKHQLGRLVLHGEAPDNLTVRMGDRLYRKDRWLNPDFGEEALDEDPWEASCEVSRERSWVEVSR
jgi:hypothetical protein